MHSSATGNKGILLLKAKINIYLSAGLLPSLAGSWYHFFSRNVPLQKLEASAAMGFRDAGCRPPLWKCFSYIRFAASNNS